MATEEDYPTIKQEEGTEEKQGDKGTAEDPQSPAIDAKEADVKAHTQSAKVDKILDACRRRDIEELQSLAESPGGFVTDVVRQQACESKSCHIRVHLRAAAHHSPLTPWSRDTIDERVSLMLYTQGLFCWGYQYDFEAMTGMRRFPMLATTTQSVSRLQSRTMGHGRPFHLTMKRAKLN